MSDIGTDLSVMMCAHDALESAVGVWREGEARVVAKPAASSQWACTCPSRAFEDEHVCAGEPDVDREAAIEAGLDAAGLDGSEEREAARRALRGEQRGRPHHVAVVRGDAIRLFRRESLRALAVDGRISRRCHLRSVLPRLMRALVWRWADACKAHRGDANAR